VAPVEGSFCADTAIMLEHNQSTYRTRCYLYNGAATSLQLRAHIYDLSRQNRKTHSHIEYTK